MSTPADKADDRLAVIFPALPVKALAQLPAADRSTITMVNRVLGADTGSRCLGAGVLLRIIRPRDNFERFGRSASRIDN
jgi:hypothetical protein